jgi:hypothetical protein
VAKLERIDGLWMWVRVQFFRLWTALFVLGAYAYFWLNEPEYLTWWKRATDALIEKSCALLPYPWGDRVESTIGDFGLWVQITLTILLFRILVGVFILAFRSNTHQSPVPRRAEREPMQRDGLSSPSPPSSRPPPEAL